MVAFTHFGCDWFIGNSGVLFKHPCGALYLYGVLIGAVLKSKNSLLRLWGAAFLIVHLVSAIACAEEDALREYYPNKQLRSIEPLVNGKRHGIGLYYHENGTKYSEIPWKNGGKHGQFKLYRADGTLEQELSYKDGLIHGLLRWYSKEGKLTQEQYYKNDKMDGLGKYFHPNGTPKQELFFKNGIQQGPAKWFRDSGELYAEATYANGKLHGSSNYYHKDGSLSSHEIYVDGVAQGISETYYHGSGVVSSRKRYENGKVIGKQEYFSRDGSPDKFMNATYGSYYDEPWFMFLSKNILWVPIIILSVTIIGPLVIVAALLWRKRKHPTAIDLQIENDTGSETVTCELASFFRRVLALLADVLLAVAFTPLWIFLMRWSLENKSATPVVLYTVFWQFLLIFFVVRFGGTPGKLVTNVRIVSASGQFLTWNKAILRMSPYLALMVLQMFQMHNAVKSFTGSLEPFTLDKMGKAFESVGGESYIVYMVLLNIFVLFDSAFMLWDKKNRAIHDFMAGSFVILKKA